MSDARLQTATVMAASPALSRTEFVAMIAMVFAVLAFSIDAMLPALPEIAAEISPDAPNRAQLVLTSFVLGMGIGTFFTGPLSDSFGRKPVILGGTAIYVLGAVLAGQAQSLDQMIAARMLQGLGVAAPRVVGMAIIRDLYSGRFMAQIMSYAMMVFTLVPAVAPMVGAGLIAAAGWRAIFAAFVLFAVAVIGWLMLRQPETLPPAARRPFRFASLLQATRTCFEQPVFGLSTFLQALIFAILFGCLSSIQSIFEQSYGRGEGFPFWFALIALLSAMGSVLNARLVVRLGMRRMVLAGFTAQVGISAVVLCLLVFTDLPFAGLMIWLTSIFFMVGLIIGNLNALAMEPLGQIAGLAASIIGSVATVLGVALAVPIGLAFDGTPLPLAAAVLGLSSLAALLARFRMPPN